MTGTRFRLFPQWDEGMAAEVVTVSSPAGSLGPGPSDRAMHVIDAVAKRAPYDPPVAMPPWRGPVHAPARPGPGGHFDHLTPHSPQFVAAHLFGTVRHTLDVWEGYLGHPVRWWHAEEFPRLELVPVVGWPNAQSGPGFLEMGVWPAGRGDWQPFALNQDVVAHEVGHAILFGVVGVPHPDRFTREFLAFHESFSDLTGLISALHFGSVRRRLLAQTAGNLYVLNTLSRLAETAAHAQIRIASNTTTLADVADLTLDRELQWHDPSGRGRNAHALAEPLTGAVFDVLVELFQEGLVARRLIRAAGPGGRSREAVAASLAPLAHETGRAHARFAAGFEAALLAARDAVGRAMAHAIATLGPEQVDFAHVAGRLLESFAAEGLAPLLGRLRGHFSARGILPALPVRRQGGRAGGFACPCGAHVVLARRAMTHPHRSALVA